MHVHMFESEKTLMGEQQVFHAKPWDSLACNHHPKERWMKLHQIRSKAQKGRRDWLLINTVSFTVLSSAGTQRSRSRIMQQWKNVCNDVR